MRRELLCRCRCIPRVFRSCARSAIKKCVRRYPLRVVHVGAGGQDSCIAHRSGLDSWSVRDPRKLRRREQDPARSPTMIDTSRGGVASSRYSGTWSTDPNAARPGAMAGLKMSSAGRWGAPWVSPGRVSLGSESGGIVAHPPGCQHESCTSRTLGHPRPHPPPGCSPGVARG